MRQEELGELDKLKALCPFPPTAPVEEPAGKACVLLQAYVSNLKVTAFTLISDCNYIAQNGGRVARALFETALRQSWSSLAERLLNIAKAGRIESV